MFDWLQKKKSTCEICRKHFSIYEMIPVKKMGPSLIPILKAKNPNHDPNGMICRDDFKQLRLYQIHTLFDHDDTSSINLENILIEEELSSVSVNEEYQKQLTFGERFAQKITPFIGSWAFILLFLGFIFFWISYNLQDELDKHFDPFPFILLNLFLSCMAAIQAPIIMMSQNRIAKRERLRADEDYYTGLKTELEIRELNTKFDEFLRVYRKDRPKKENSDNSISPKKTDGNDHTKPNT